MYCNNYPDDYIIDYAMDPSVPEYASALHGNYSAPVQEQGFLDWIHDRWLPELKVIHLGKEYKHDHHYVNYHMDDEGSWLETHNDLKGFRWLITSQIYLNDSTGVVVGDRAIPCKTNYFYSLDASPYSWHNVPTLLNIKKSILFRVGKKRHKTVAHLQQDKPAWVIVNDGHSDSHYAKLGLRMGNLTEAWLHHLGYANIYHSEWRQDPSEIIALANRKHKDVTVIQSGEFPFEEHITLTDANINDYAEQMFNADKYNTPFARLEKIMAHYYKSRRHLDYSDIWINLSRF